MIGFLLGWVGNFFLCWGIWEIGNKRRRAHLITVVGEACWIVKSLMPGTWLPDLAFICAIFLLLALRCWFKWAGEQA